MKFVYSVRQRQAPECLCHTLCSAMKSFKIYASALILLVYQMYRVDTCFFDPIQIPAVSFSPATAAFFYL